MCVQVYQSLCASKTQGCRLCMHCTPSSVYSKQTSKLSHLSMSCSIPTCTSHSIAHQSLSQYNAPELVVGYSTQCAHECSLSTILLSSPYLHAQSVLLLFSVAITFIDNMCHGAHGHSYAITSCTTLPLPLGIKIISNSDLNLLSLITCTCVQSMGLQTSRLTYEESGHITYTLMHFKMKALL